ncbi:MAG: hypothetical protein U1D55_01000 [Phycisphaerae bacterium]
MSRYLSGCAIVCLLAALAQGQYGYVNWENHPIHPLEITPDGTRLLAINLPDARLEIFDITGVAPLPLGQVPVGVDPVSVRALSNTQAWVVNHISDSVSVVDLVSLNVIATIKTADEPFDIVFAGSPLRAFVSCSQANQVQVLDPLNPLATPLSLPIDAEDPRAMAVSPDGATVYVAIFESGNASTVLGGGIDGAQTALAFPPNVVSNAAGPYGGVNPPPNAGAAFDPPILAANLPAPKVGLIVKKNAQGQWRDDNTGDWTSLVSGVQAGLSGRPAGWDLPDRDVAVIDANTLALSYATGLMNINMAIGVNPASGAVTVVGTDGTNEIRFEPNIQGTFVRVKFASLAAPVPSSKSIVDLNAHLNYAVHTTTQAERDKSIGDPRGIIWNAAGTKAYVPGMGSNNVIVINAVGARVGLADTINVGEGPIGGALDEPRNRLYVLNRFAGSISVIDTTTETELSRTALHDPTPSAIKIGRKHLYDTHKTSGLGQTSCASCHVDSRMDRLAWDLGNPQGASAPTTGQNLGAGIPGLSGPPFGTPFLPWHPMKGPMTTQTLQDIIGKEPLHWRGDRAGIENFNGAFVGLLGDDVQLTATEMQEFEDLLATITIPPNPNRNLDNTLPTSLPLPGHFTTGRFGPAGLPLPTGNPQAGLALYRSATRRLDGGAFACVTCHTLPIGIGTNYTLSGATYVPIPVGPNGEFHHQLVSVDGSTNRTIKTPQLRTLFEKIGFDCTQTSNRAGFGYIHDGSVDSLARFVAEPAFNTASNQEVADLVSFLLCFSGSDLPQGSTTNLFEPPGTPSKDTHAAVGAQTTLVDALTAPPSQLSLISTLISLADAGKIGLIVKGRVAGLQRGYMYDAATHQFLSDRAAETRTTAALHALAAPGSELTYTAVPFGTQRRMGIDRDADSYLDRDELEACADPANPASIPGGPGTGLPGDLNGDHLVNEGDLGVLLAAWQTTAGGDLDGDNDTDEADLGILLANWQRSCP